MEVRNLVKSISIFIMLFCISSNNYGQSQTCSNLTNVTCDPNTSFVFNTSGGSGGGGSNTDYGCLFTTPNPRWYVWASDFAGPIDIIILTTPCVDIDYILYGPFDEPFGNCDSLTQANTMDCSYAASCNNETISGNLISGKFYILLITNYGNITTDITLTQTSGAGSLGGPLTFVAIDTLSLCEDLVYLETIPPQNDPDVVINSITGTGITDTNLGIIDPSLIPVEGIYTYTVEGISNGCNTSTSMDIFFEGIDNPFQFNTNGPFSVCSNTITLNTTPSLPDLEVTVSNFSGVGAINNNAEIDLSQIWIPGDYTYQISGKQGSCLFFEEITISINSNCDKSSPVIFDFGN